MADQWAKNNWLSTDAVTHTRLNDIGNSMRTWGYGETAGTVTINANQNNISAMGQLAFHSAGSVASLLPISVTAPGGTSGNESIIQNMSFVDGGNGVFMRFKSRRISTGSGHATVAFRAQRLIDATEMGYIDWFSNGIAIGNGTTEYFRVESGGVIKAFLGGSMRTLGYSGGIVTAT